LSEIIYYECHFCQKTLGLFPEQRKLCEKLSGTQFYCHYCLQNNFNTKNNQHILMLSFRSIIGFYYQYMHLTTLVGNNGHKLYLSQIEDYVDAHEVVGLKNPVFRYDPESFIWFIDFSRIGKGKKKIPLREVMKSIVNILSCFNLPGNIDFIKTSKLFEKYEEAVVKFHTERYRPQNKKLLVPTLVNCGGICDNKVVDHDSLKNFNRSNFLIKSY